MTPQYSAANLYNNRLSTQYGSGLDAALESYDQGGIVDPTVAGKKEMARSAQAGMSAGGTAGQVLTGAGATGLMMGAGAATGGGALAAGLALSYMEQKKQEEAAHERAVIDEAQNRKVAVQNAINGQLNAARMLSV